MTDASGDTKVVLIVDPDGVASGALGRSLKRLGCEPQSCWDMHAALIAARAERPALVIASSELLDGDGFMLCDTLRSESELAGLPVVLLCNESEAEAVERHQATATKADQYLTRPLSVTAILQRVGKYLTDDSAPSSGEEDELSLNTGFEEVEPIEERRKPPPPPMRAKSAVPQDLTPSPPSVDDVPPAPRMPQIDLPPVHEEEAVPAPPPAPTPTTTTTSTATSTRTKSFFPPRSSKSAFPSATPSMRASGLSTREYLDLKEQLNVRDRELHQIREDFRAAEARHTEVLERAEGLRAANMELVEKIRERDEALGNTATLVQQLEAARADKELANKRADTFVAKAERAKKAAEEDREELKRLTAAHAEELSKLESKHREELAAMYENAERLSFDAVQKVQIDLTDAHAEVVAELREKVARADELRDAALAEQKAAHDAEVAKERARADHDIDVAAQRIEREREETRAEAAADKAKALEALRTELSADYDKKLTEARAALETELKKGFEKERAADRKRADAEALQALTEQESELRAQFDKRYADLRASLESEAAVAITAVEDRHKRAAEDLEKKLRAEIEAKLTAEKEKALEEAREAADAELKALEKMSDLQVADMMRERNRAREDAEKNAAAEKARIAEIAAMKVEHEKALEGLRAEHAHAFATSGEKIAGLEKNLAAEVQRREAAEQRLSRDREILSRARDSLAEAMRGVDIARDPEQS